MGKYTRKARIAGDIPLPDVSPSPLGVRTRSQTLALQHLQSSTAVSPPLKTEYLELRSRRLEKSPIVKNSPKTSPQKQGCVCMEKENSRGETGDEVSGSGLRTGMSHNEIEVLEIEPFFGENNLNFEARGRSTRESTPSSFISATNTINSIERAQVTIFSNFPTLHDIEEFFGHTSPSQQLFTEKYNFDFANEVPLPGQYEWVKVMP